LTLDVATPEVVPVYGVLASVLVEVTVTGWVDPLAAVVVLTVFCEVDGVALVLVLTVSGEPDEEAVVTTYGVLAVVAVEVESEDV
jgi:hypothetical protein